MSILLVHTLQTVLQNNMCTCSNWNWNLFTYRLRCVVIIQRCWFFHISIRLHLAANLPKWT